MASPDQITPRPIPQFFNEYNHLATKKERYSSTPKPQLPPRPPSKSIAQYSRLSFTFNNSQQQNQQKAQIITFNHENPPKLSPLYDRNLKESYLKQCYHIEEKIGSGSFGDVFRVKSFWDKKYYAVKVSREKFKGKIDREEKLNEVCKHEQLPHHDHLVKLHCAWEEKQRLYIKTELCAGTLLTLAENNHDIPEETVWAYLVDLLKAIDHLHSNDLIHLDVKPENIFISRDGLCKLGDFGLIFDINHHLKEATEGDPKYLAGEVMQGIFTKSADIFSLGMTILEIACDLDLPSRGDAWHMLRDGKIPDYLFENLSNNLKTIITMMLNPDYKNRPTARELLNHPIVRRYEWKRRYHLIRKKLIALFRDKIQLIDHFVKNDSTTNGFVLYYAWSGVKHVLTILTYPLRFICNYMFYNQDQQGFLFNKNNNNQVKNSPNYNRTYVSNYLDQYSDDDEVTDNRYVSNLSFDMSFSSDEEIFCNNLRNNRNLCSTLNRNQNNHSVSRFLPPKLSPLEQHGNKQNTPNNVNYESIKSVIQRLTFDEFSSDEMEMPEKEKNEDKNETSASRSVDSTNSIAIASPKACLENATGGGNHKQRHPQLSSSSQHVNNIRLLRSHNASRKNLMKTFDEIEEIKT